MNEAWHAFSFMRVRQVPHIWSHTWIWQVTRVVTHMNEVNYTWMRLYMNESRMRQMTRMNETGHTFLFVRVRQVTHIVTRMTEVPYTREWGYIWMSQGWGKSHTWMRQVTHIGTPMNEVRYRWMRLHMTRLYVLHDSFTWIHMNMARMRQVTHMNEASQTFLYMRVGQVPHI